LGIRTEIVGHSDQTGSDEVNVDLSRQRADNVLAALVLRGLKPINISTVGAATRDPLKEGTSEEEEINRSVTFRVVLYAAF
jgi:outer membrane protein OmpA-like peptidoglycan-associated protein